VRPCPVTLLLRRHSIRTDIPMFSGISRD